MPWKVKLVKKIWLMIVTFLKECIVIFKSFFLPVVFLGRFAKRNKKTTAFIILCLGTLFLLKAYDKHTNGSLSNQINSMKGCSLEKILVTIGNNDSKGKGETKIKGRVEGKGESTRKEERAKPNPQKEELDGKLDEIIDERIQVYEHKQFIKLGASADPSWKVLLNSKGKKGRKIDSETLNRWMAELQQMRYRCFAYYNQRVDVACWQNEHFCNVSFASVVGEDEYRMYFKSEITADGFDKIVEWKVYKIKPATGWMTVEARARLIDQIIEARPNCNPFSTN